MKPSRSSGDLRLRVERADPDEGDACAVGERADQLPGPLALEQGALLDRVGHDRRRHRVAGSSDPVGEPHDDVEGARASVPRRRAYQGDDLVLRSLHRLDLTDRGAQRSPGAESEHDRDLGREMRFQLPRGCAAQAEHAVLVGVARHDLGVVQAQIASAATSSSSMQARIG